MLVLFIMYPWLALVPAAALGVAYAARRAGLALFAASVWAAYFFYEMGMKLRILCTGECNIRVDLLLIYPALAVLTVAAIVALVRKRVPAS